MKRREDPCILRKLEEGEKIGCKVKCEGRNRGNVSVVRKMCVKARSL